MHYWLGIPMLVAAAWFVRDALIHRAKARAAGQRPEEMPAPVNESLAAARDIFPPIMIGALVYAGLKACLAFAMFNASEILSIVDLGGFLALLASYGTWLVLRTRYRDATVVPVPVEAEPVTPSTEHKERPAIAA
ncbi:MAG: hypothetical protein ACE363_03685 [Alphaproteobacteria bacterium]